MVFSKLFGGKKNKPKRRKPGKAVVRTQAKPPAQKLREIDAADLEPIQEGRWGLAAQRQESEKVVAKIGGAEEVAAIIKSLLAEDKLKR